MAKAENDLAPPPADSPPARRHALHSIAARALDHPGESGCAVIADGADALLARLALAAHAIETLDVQYYLWHDDATGRLLARGLLDAADRGVRVRMLIDDIHLAGRDTGFAVLDRHRNIAIRIFNPFRARAWPSWQRLVEAVREGSRLNHRMHNKTFIADRQFAIVGGRNIGDEYFAASETANFRDMDLLTIGPVVVDISTSFEQFWNSKLAVPVRGLTPIRPTKRMVRRWYRRLRRSRLPRTSLAGFSRLTSADLCTELDRMLAPLHWGRARVVYDPPGKVDGTQQSAMAELMNGLASTVQRELLIESAYFIPDDRSLGVLSGLRDRGVAITVLTNSLASNDVIAAHAGYAAQRRTLLQLGIRLFEVRSKAARREATAVGSRVGSRASLHSKAAVFDRSTVFVGTLNFDPRSLYINTEIGLIIDSPGLAAAVGSVIGKALRPETSFSVVLEPPHARGRIRWYAAGTTTELFTDEPETSRLRRVVAWVYRQLPIHRWL